jgi:hypothetical protein
MKPTTDINGTENYKSKKKKLFFIEDEIRQSLNVTISVNNPSSSSNSPIYERQRTIHCQKQVS